MRKKGVMQLFLAMTPANHGQSVSALQSCLNSRHIWFCENGMAPSFPFLFFRGGLRPALSPSINCGPMRNPDITKG